MKELKKPPTAPPRHCVGCRCYLGGSRKPGARNKWCCKYSTGVHAAQSICLQQDGKEPK